MNNLKNTFYYKYFVEWKDSMDVKGSSWNHQCQEALLSVLFNIKFPKGGFRSNAIQEQFWLLQRNFSEQFLKIIIIILSLKNI